MGAIPPLLLLLLTFLLQLELNLQVPSPPLLLLLLLLLAPRGEQGRPLLPLLERDLSLCRRHRHREGRRPQPMHLLPPRRGRPERRRRRRRSRRGSPPPPTSHTLVVAAIAAVERRRGSPLDGINPPGPEVFERAATAAATGRRKRRRRRRKRRRMRGKRPLLRRSRDGGRGGAAGLPRRFGPASGLPLPLSSPFFLLLLGLHPDTRPPQLSGVPRGQRVRRRCSRRSRRRRRSPLARALEASSR